MRRAELVEGQAEISSGSGAQPRQARDKSSRWPSIPGVLEDPFHELVPLIVDRRQLGHRYQPPAKTLPRSADVTQPRDMCAERLGPASFSAFDDSEAADVCEVAQHRSGLLVGLADAGFQACFTRFHASARNAPTPVGDIANEDSITLPSKGECGEGPSGRLIRRREESQTLPAVLDGRKAPQGLMTTLPITLVSATGPNTRLSSDFS